MLSIDRNLLGRNERRIKSVICVEADLQDLEHQTAIRASYTELIFPSRSKLEGRMTFLQKWLQILIHCNGLKWSESDQSFLIKVYTGSTTGFLKIHSIERSIITLPSNGYIYDEPFQHLPAYDSFRNGSN